MEMLTENGKPSPQLITEGNWIIQEKTRITRLFLCPNAGAKGYRKISLKVNQEFCFICLNSVIISIWVRIQKYAS